MDNLPKKNNHNSMVNQEKLSRDITDRKTGAQGLLNRKLTVLQRVFPSIEDKASKKHTKLMLDQESKSEIEKHRMSNEFFNQALQATFDDVLTRGIMAIQKGQSKDFVKISSDSIREINQLMMEFFEDMEKDEERIAQMKSDKLREKQNDMLYDRIDEFEITVTQLMQKLKDAANKSVGKKE
jgi:CHASE3 domain sensor protein